MELVLGVGCMASVAVLVFAIALSKRTELWDSLLRNVTPTIMLGIAGIALLAGDLKMFAAFFTIIGFACLVSLTWILLASFARNLNGSYTFVFGLGYGIIQAASIIGAIMANYFSSQGQLSASIAAAESMDIVGFTSEVGLSDLAIVLMVVFSAGYALIPRYRELKEILSSLMLALARESSEKGEDELSEKSYNDVEPETDTTNKPPLAANESNLSVEEDSFEGQLTQNSESSPDQVKAASEEAPDINEAVEEAGNKRGSFTRRCDELSEQFSLSTREREAFFYLAKGHNAAFLTEKLCISRSTAKTHINHIYKKMGIHTQQELLNMVEDRHRGPVLGNIDRAALQDALKRVNEEGPLERDPSELVEHIRQDIR